MAIDPSATYGVQVDTSTDPTGWPFGRARNISISGDGTGTPWEEQHVSDLWGFLQSLLVESGQTPSGTPDKVGASQYFDAIDALFLRKTAKAIAASYRVSTGTVAIETPLIVTEVIDPASQFALTGGGGGGDTVQVPQAGIYRASWQLAVRTDSTGDGQRIDSFLRRGGIIETGGGTAIRRASAHRYGTSTSNFAHITGTAIFSITDPATEKLQLELEGGGVGPLTIVDSGDTYNFFDLNYLGAA